MNEYQYKLHQCSSNKKSPAKTNRLNHTKNSNSVDIFIHQNQYKLLQDNQKLHDEIHNLLAHKLESEQLLLQIKNNEQKLLNIIEELEFDNQQLIKQNAYLKTKINTEPKGYYRRSGWNV